MHAYDTTAEEDSTTAAVYTAVVLNINTKTNVRAYYRVDNSSSSSSSQNIDRSPLTSHGGQDETSPNQRRSLSVLWDNIGGLPGDRQAQRNATHTNDFEMQ